MMEWSEIKEEWTRRLRSGEYKQGYGKLYRSSDNTYCCLGVLAEVIRHPVGDGDGIIDESVLNEHGLGFIDQRWLSRLNDGEPRWTFPEIASWIEENY